jgi:hypothetical protein
MQGGRRWCGFFVLLLFMAVAPCGPSFADEQATDSPHEEAKRWEVEVLVPMWIFGNYGTVKVADRVARVDVSPGDTIDLLTSGDALAGEGYFELRYDNFFTYADALGGYVETSVSETVPTDRFPRLSGLDIDADLKLKLVLADFGVGYRLGQWWLPNRRRPVTIGLFTGARYYWFHTRVRASSSIRATLPRRELEVHRAADVSDEFDWADPFVGVRWEVPVLDCLSLEFRGDIGGFDAGSELAWNVVGGLRYWVDWHPFSTRPWLGAGYRALGFEYEPGSQSKLDLQFRGPYGGIGVAF